MQPLRGEFIPGEAKGIDDGVVSGQHSMAEVALAQVESDAPDWVQFGAVGR